jgi:hypothetical protein
MIAAAGPQAWIGGTGIIAEQRTLKGRFARSADDRASPAHAAMPPEREAWLLNCDWTHGFLFLLLAAAGIVGWPLLWTGTFGPPSRTLGALFFLGVAVETLLIRSKLRAALAMGIYRGIFLDRTGETNTPGLTVLFVATAHGALAIAGTVMALNAIGGVWSGPNIAVILLLTIVICRAVYVGFMLATPGEGPGSGPAGAMLLEFGGALHATIFVMLVWSSIMHDPNDWAIKADARPGWVQALLMCAPAVAVVLVSRLPIALIERRGARSRLGRLLRWFLFGVAALGAISPVALLAVWR